MIFKKKFKGIPDYEGFTDNSKNLDVRRKIM